jgi:hypothetical protein
MIPGMPFFYALGERKISNTELCDDSSKTQLVALADTHEERVYARRDRLEFAKRPTKNRGIAPGAGTELTQSSPVSPVTLNDVIALPSEARIALMPPHVIVFPKSIDALDVPAAPLLERFPAEAKP